MAKRKPEKRFNIRHRLVGAIVLFGLGVIFIPMVLQGHGPGLGKKSESFTENVQEWIVGTEEAETYVSRVVPVGESGAGVITKPVMQEDEDPPQLAVIEEAAPVNQPQTRTQEPQVPEPQNEPQTQPEQVAAVKPVPEPPEPAAPAPKTENKESLPGIKPDDVARGWVVQVGTFSKPENAHNLIARLDKFGFESRYEVVTTDAGQATRVWIGPYEKRVTAGKALNVVKDKTGVKGFIKSFP